MLSKFVPYYCLHYIITRILHMISRKSWYSMQPKSWWWAIPKICMYLISWFYSSCANLMLAKYTCFTVWHTYLGAFDCHLACAVLIHVMRSEEWSVNEASCTTSTVHILAISVQATRSQVATEHSTSHCCTTSLTQTLTINAHDRGIKAHMFFCNKHSIFNLNKMW